MSKEFIKEDGLAKIRYSNQYECLADSSKESRVFLKSTPCKKAKVAGEFAILRRSKRGLKYILIYCNEYNIEFESGDAETMTDLSVSDIDRYFNPEVLKAKDLIESYPNRIDLSVRHLKNIYKSGISRARNIEYLAKFDINLFYKDILPNFLNTNSCRTKVFITPNLRSKIGG